MGMEHLMAGGEQNRKSLRSADFTDPRGLGGHSLDHITVCRPLRGKMFTDVNKRSLKKLE